MKNQKGLFVIGLIFVVGFVLYHFYAAEDIADNGKVYSSKVDLCRQFAQSYLRTIGKTDNITDFGSEKWKMAIDVETELYNMCRLDLNKETLKNYKPSSLEKYQK